eukprot:2582390-Pyramimonas_sp.AAC.1
MSRAKRWFCKIGGCLERWHRGGPEFKGCLRRNACFHVPLAGLPRMSRACSVPRVGILMILTGCLERNACPQHVP